MSGFWLLRVRDEFSSAHALRNYHGKCENLHGHNFFVEVAVCGNRLNDQTGMLVDFKVLRNGLKRILADFDHLCINEHPPFDAINPSSENMAREIWLRFSEFVKNLPEAQAGSLWVYSVTVSEKNTQEAAYFGNGLNLDK